MAMFLGARKATYMRPDDAATSREQRMARLKTELRDHIRLLSDYEILSADWMTMAASLHQIANVAFMETRLSPLDENPLTQHGKKDTGTLWDQERDEIAIRIILEEGKLNLALRILHKYRQTVRQTDKWDETVQAAAKRFNTEAPSILERCRAFEHSLGALLKFALAHVEALQILDLPEFLQHIKEELTDALASERKSLPTDGEKSQETLVIHYLACLGAKIEEMEEDRVMDLIYENNVLGLLIDHMHKHYGWYRLETLQASAIFFNACFNSEAYAADKDRYVPNRDVMTKIVDLKGFYIHHLVATYGTKLKEVSKLLDELEKFERLVGKATILPLELKDAERKPTGAGDERKEGASGAVSVGASGSVALGSSGGAKHALPGTPAKRP